MKMKRPSPKPTLPNKQQTVEDNSKRARETALNLLARREHSVLELRHKLSQRGFERAVIDPVLAHLSAENYLSDQRFAEVYSHSRADRGYGPLRIRSELRERGIDDATVNAVLTELDDFWLPKLSQLQRKRFGDTTRLEFAERARQTRFLRQRGYTLEQINRLFQSP